MNKIELYADGSSLNNPGDSGAGIVLIRGTYVKHFSIPLGHQSNMRAELLAIIKGVELIKNPAQISIYSDNQVSINIINGANQASSNLDLWKQWRFAIAEHQIALAQWIKKDSHEHNITCHDLANRASKSQQYFEKVISK